MTSFIVAEVRWNALILSETERPKLQRFVFRHKWRGALTPEVGMPVVGETDRWGNPTFVQPAP